MVTASEPISNAESSPLQHIGILHHPRKPESQVLAEEMAAFIRERCCDPWIASSWDEPDVMPHLPGTQLLVTLGGDGTILRAARMGARFQVPILGVKLGRLGFLAEVDPERWREPLGRALEGDYWLEERLMLDVTVHHRTAKQPHQHHYEALNDVVVGRGRLARIVRVATYLDEGYLTTYAADGVIVATPTGSTGYALACGGPILPPELRNMLLIPIAPHLSLDRAIVLAEGDTVRMEVDSDHETIVTIDGQFRVDLDNGDRVEVTSSSHMACFVRLRDRSYFYRELMERLRWHL
ncbi:MAG: NAD(+)/NADH kinase [Anaerolineae bacterium]